MSALDLVRKIRHNLICPNCLCPVKSDETKPPKYADNCVDFPPGDFAAWPESQMPIQQVEESALRGCYGCRQLLEFIYKHNDKDLLLAERGAIQWGNVASGTWHISRPFSPFTHGEIYEILSEGQPSSTIFWIQLSLGRCEDVTCVNSPIQVIQ